MKTDVDDDGYPPLEVEELHVEDLGPGRARLLGTPVFVYGTAPGDVLQYEVRTPDGLGWVEAVLESADHWIARIVPLAGQDLRAIVQEFVGLGCNASSTPFGVVTVDVPPEVPLEPVLGALRAGVTDQLWDYDLGVDPTA